MLSEKQIARSAQPVFSLQARDIDAYRAMLSVDSCINAIQIYREDSSFDNVFEKAQKSLGEDEELEMPRVVGRMNKRANPPADTPYQYFRRAIYLPYIDTIQSQLRERFSKHKTMWKGLFSLVPEVIRQDEIDIKNIEDLADIYSNIIPGTKLELVTETKRWVEVVKSADQAELPSSIVESLKLCHKLQTYPNIEALLKILATLPVSTCTAERSFSALKHVKSYLRATMTEKRLNGLAALYIHKDLILNKEAVINESSRGNRRMKFV